MSAKKRESSSKEDWKEVRKSQGKGGFLPRKSYNNFKTQ